MARTEDREKAIALRKKGMSYSQIKEKIGVNKSTLSYWLSGMPLSSARLKVLRNTEAQIEKIRETKRRKKLARRAQVYKKVSNDIKNSTDIDFISGFYLYWGEGTKTAEYAISLTNSDPAVIRCFVEWVQKLGVCTEQLKIKLHLYTDQNEDELKLFWSQVTGIPVDNFYKTYIKSSASTRKTYKGMFSYGTCVIIYGNRDMYEYVLEGIYYLRDKYSKK
ncbi:helix-turn-helix domain-containing protein [Candidatus Pacebacteria bacterium]|nr:helix-turn-helix domain-containing protein [Candidatus Paceibacterota bacterium]